MKVVRLAVEVIHNPKSTCADLIAQDISSIVVNTVNDEGNIDDQFLWKIGEDGFALNNVYGHISDQVAEIGVDFVCFESEYDMILFNELKGLCEYETEKSILEYPRMFFMDMVKDYIKYNGLEC